MNFSLHFINRREFILVSAASALPLRAADAATANAPPPIEDFVKQPSIYGLTMSPNGRFFAGCAPVRGRMNLIVVDIEARKGQALTSFEEFDVLFPRWVGNERLVFTLGQINSPTGPGRFDGGGLFVVNRDGSGSRVLSPTVRETRNRNQFVYRGLSYFRTIPGNTDEIIALGNLDDAQSADLYRLHLNTGRTTLLTSGRPADRTFGWMLDSKLVPRVVKAYAKDKPEYMVFYRAGPGAPWTELATVDRTRPPVFVPIAFEADDQTLQVATNQGRETVAVYRFDPNKKELGELIAQHPRYDMGVDASGRPVPGVITEPRTGRILGYTVEADKPETVWIDETYARLQRMIDGALTGTKNSFMRTPDGKRFLVMAYSDVKPLRWYLFDEEKRTLEELAVSTPWLEGKLVEQRPFSFKARDGLELTGYYFLPRDYRPGTRLPTVVHIHGGPAARADVWGSGFGVTEAQILASRGYAVVVPNFRITPGMGAKAYYSGFGTLGRQMSDDHADALRWAVEQGFADPKRACISGASYGGYAALWAPVRTPGVFKCVVAGLPVTDWVFQNTSTETDYVADDSAAPLWRAILGTDDLRSQLARDLSPINHVDKINVPVFMYAGRDDVRTPTRQADRMAAALERAGNKPKDYFVAEKEGHGFGRVENNVELYRRMLKFLDEYLAK
ncbi:MAG: prolyl oligopeptidase family serine peptidase [Casimicrobiaceae bacterium]|nr:prolyl oligopeptidase family serine peptidase [Casimicrobiaceae bacterium]